MNRADDDYERKVADLRSEAELLQKENEDRFAAFYSSANCSQESLRELLSRDFFPSGQQNGCSARSVCYQATLIGLEAYNWTELYLIGSKKVPREVRALRQAWT